MSSTRPTAHPRQALAMVGRACPFTLDDVGLRRCSTGLAAALYKVLVEGVLQIAERRQGVSWLCRRERLCCGADVRTYGRFRALIGWAMAALHDGRRDRVIGRDLESGDGARRRAATARSGRRVMRIAKARRPRRGPRARPCNDAYGIADPSRVADKACY